LVFQAKKWGWKRVAANLLLVPLLAGGSVAVVQAQLGRSNNSPVTSMPTAASGAPKKDAKAAPSPGTDPKHLLKEGRKALAEGRFADAQDLSMRAEANNPSGKWGLFDDTPAALRKDIQAATLKKHKEQSEQLMKQAKGLATKPAANDAERAYNLDSAIQMARQADKLHGPYTAWDWGERADKLVKELEAARAKINVAATKPPANNATKPPANTVANNVPNRPPARHPNQPNPAYTAAGNNAGTHQASGIDTRKAAALKLMAEGKALADQGQFAAAKVKYTEADKLGANFSPSEPNPGFSLQELNTRGAAAMDRLVRDAQAFTAQKDFVRANAALTHAATIASTLGLYGKPVDDAKAALWAASGGKIGAAPQGGTIAANGPGLVAPPTGPTPVAPPIPPALAANNAPKPLPPVGNITGQQLLDQAVIEFKAGQFDTAENLAVKAHNHGMQKEAALLLNSIGAEKLARKQRDAAATMANAKSAFDQKDYKRSLSTLVLVEPKLLTDDAVRTREQMIAACRDELAKAGSNTDVVAAGGIQNDAPPLPMGVPPKSDDLPPAAGPTHPPGKATVNSENPTTNADAMRSLQFQKLRSEGLKVQEESQKAFGRGETDLAMQMLMDYANRVRASGLPAANVNNLLRPIEGRLDTFRMLKGQTDAQVRLDKEKRDARDRITGRGVAEEDRKKEVALLIRQCNDLVKKGDYQKAERVALQAKQLDPDEPAITALIEMTRLTRRVKEAEADKAAREQFIHYGLKDAEYQGPLVTSNNPVDVQIDALRRARLRGSGNDLYLKTRSPAEYEIELKLDKPISVQFNQTPLDQAVKNLQTLTGLPLWLDIQAMQNERISEVQLTTFDVGTPISVRNVLACILEPVGLNYVVEHDMVKITTTKKAKGRMMTKVFSVADLVTPVPNFALPNYANFDRMITNNPLRSGNLLMSGLNTGGATPRVPPGGLTGGQPVSNGLPGQLATQPGIQSSGQGGTLQTSPVAGSANVTDANNTKQEQLIRLITSMVRPYSWDDKGGAGRLEFFDIGSALVVNQTADVIREVEDLLEALRRLQDLAIAVEIRIVSLAESFFERMGVDFSVNIKTDTTKFEPALTSGNFRPQPFVNDINNKGVTIGLSPAGTFTPDLDVPIRSSSFQRAIPGFGNFPNNPGDNGGISFGLAFLNDIQVFTFMELAQGDMRSNIMQAPKLTLFNGQTATLSVNNLEFFVTNVQVVSVNGQIVFIPQNTPLPGPGDFNQGGSLNITVQAVVSADRRFVRLNLPVNLGVQSGASVPLFPVTTFITPVFEGGSQGQPIPFTQFLQQPAFTDLNIQTTVVCPDGGTVLLGGLKTVRESRNEFGPPFLSKIPYLNRLFKNVGVGRDTRHTMIMVTPRIIINSEEEIFQTEGRLPNQGVNQ
jgi:type II secretory pathway component GspD/PulD (secretin)